MEPGRPLREAFAELLNDESARSAYATDPDGFLGAYGHGDLPGSLVAEAIVNFADSASAGVAEHLAPYVIAQSGVAEPGDDAPADPGFGLDLLATAPAGLELAEPLFDEAVPIPGPAEPYPGEPTTGVELGSDPGEPPADTGDHPNEAAEHPADLDFGTGWLAAVPPADTAPGPTPDIAPDAVAEPDPGLGLDAIPAHVDVDGTDFEPDPVTGPLELPGTGESDQPAGDAAEDGTDAT